jgi:hypothetical protein
MDSEKISRWLTLAANVGVIAGLVLVAIQINQNTQITKAQIANDYFLADMELELAMMGEHPAHSWNKAVYAPNDLTTLDAVILDRYFNYGLVQIHRLQEMDDMGMAHEGWEERVNYLRWHLGNEVGRRWWEQVKHDYSEDFRVKVDEILAGSDYGSNREILDALMPATNTPAR